MCFQENIRFSEEQEEMYVDTSSAALEFSEAWRGLWLGGWCAASLVRSLCGGDTAEQPSPRRRRNSERHALRRRSGWENHREASIDTLSRRSVGDSSWTLRGTVAVKESTVRSSTQECSATRRETVFSHQRVAQKSIPNCREGSPGRSEKNEKSIA